jgi:hypothetical protein
MSNLPTLIVDITGIPTRATRQEDEIKRIQMWREEVKILQFANDVILCLKNLKLLNIINTFGNVTF